VRAVVLHFIHVDEVAVAVLVDDRAVATLGSESCDSEAGGFDDTGLAVAGGRLVL
jgi:hypothetical protein